MVTKKFIQETMVQWIERSYQFMLVGDLYIEQFPEEILEGMDAKTFYNCVALMQANRIAYRRLKDEDNLGSEESAEMERYKKNIIYFEGLVNNEVARVNAIMYCQYLEESEKRKARK